MKCIALGLPILLACCAPSGPEAAPGPIAELAGRIPGPPQRCVPISSTAALRIANGSRLIYADGSTVWLNTADCPGMGWDDIPVLHPTASQHCRGDIVETLGRTSNIRGPSCVLGDFVPYRLPPR